MQSRNGGSGPDQAWSAQLRAALPEVQCAATALRHGTSYKPWYRPRASAWAPQASSVHWAVIAGARRRC